MKKVEDKGNSCNMMGFKKINKTGTASGRNSNRQERNREKSTIQIVTHD